MATLDKEDECWPLYTLEELLNWQPKYRPDSGSNLIPVPLSPSYKLRNKKRTLVCHDMKGGYLEDRFTNGVAGTDAYRFFHWAYVDIFVYFSHYFISIPPVSWINAAHKHDVLILGTFITEWDDGKVRCEEILKSEESFKMVANQMVSVAKHYGFDGWLINVENVIQKDKVPVLRDFVQYLTDELHREIPSSMVVWYDSVIETGELKWQDQLNDQNKLFFDVCDGIFLNYTWTEEKLQKSQEEGTKCDRPWDVYVGIDVWGRGCLGGGGFDTCQAAEVVRRHNLSIALFAQGWVYEKADDDAKLFTHNEYRFWKLLEQYMEDKEIRALPFYTSFCQGQGDKYYQNGKIIGDTAWTNLSLQSIQPLIANNRNTCSNLEDESKLDSCITYEDAFNGGGCLRLGGKFTKARETFYPKLLTFNDIEISSSNLGKELLIAYSVKHSAVTKDVDVFIDVGVKQKVDGKRVRYRLCARDNNAELTQNVQNMSASGGSDVESDEISTICLECMKSEDSFKGAVATQLETGENGWETRIYVFENMSDCILQDIHVGVLCNNTVEVYPTERFFLLGQIQISGINVLNNSCLVNNPEIVSSLVVQNDDSNNLISFSSILEWSHDYDETATIDRFNIYFMETNSEESSEKESKVDENWKYLGTRLFSLAQIKKKCSYKISNLVVDLEKCDLLKFKIQPVCYNGLSVMLNEVPTAYYSISLS